MTSDLDLLKTFAPVVRLHPWDHHRPSSVEAFLSRASLYDADNEVIVNHPTPEQLVAEQQDGCYVAWDSEQTIPTKDNDRYTGLEVHPVPGRPREAACTAPCYGRAFHEDGFIDLVYSFYYEFNGFQTCRSNIWVGVHRRHYNFEWANFARHQGDWEHVTVRVKTPEMEVLGVYFTGHGKARYVPYDELAYADADHRRAIIYSALNSHASYEREAIYTLKSIDMAFLPFSWLSFVDITSPPDDRLKVYQVPTADYARVEWDTAGHMVDCATDPQAKIWMQFNYPWGQNVLDNTDIQKAPSGLPAGAGTAAKNWANTLKPIIMKIAKDKLYPKGPADPQARGWFRDKESMPQFLHTETLGGPHGGDFDDAPHVDPKGRITAITIYSGKRVDGLAVAYSDGYVAAHGAGVSKAGLGVSTLELDPDEHIVRMGGARAEKKGHSRVGYLEIHTNKGRSISGGSGPANQWVYDSAEDRYAPFAFFGRSGEELDQLGLVLTSLSPFAGADQDEAAENRAPEPA